MHFVGIKCEVCNKLDNCKDPIDDLPTGWIALAQRFQYYVLFRREVLHFCSMKCLCAWAREQEEPTEAKALSKQQVNDSDIKKREALALELIARKFDYIERVLVRIEKQAQ